MADEPKPTLEQVRASVRDALRKLTGETVIEPEVAPPVSQTKRKIGGKPKPGSV